MDNKVKVAVLVSGGGTNLGALLESEKNGIIKSGRISLCLSSNPDAYALSRAKDHNIKTAVVSKKQYSTQKLFEEQILNLLRENDIELIVLAGFMCILSENFTTSYPKRIINVHPSLIPSFCGKGFYGLHVHEAALDYGVKLTGATVHFVNEIPDGGEIILQKAVAVRQNDTPQTLQRRVMEQAEWKILPRGVELVCRKILKDGNSYERIQNT
jgi:phosphoribosylglycinamide formyltransferase-1